ncbi:spermidine synthase-like [Asterias amurensis]|uniref:spermidine synthase-like n=1 Tax=Asterias amurensis TaxID=7602 RepID=UPI003AB35FB1
MDCLREGWFSELSTLWPGQCLSLKVKEVLYHEKSQYQDVLVFKSENYGNVLILDGVIQCTERDEFSYHEMISHLPLNSHPNPQKVLVVGGGDGGVIREVVKHPQVESVTQCEIDEKVIEVSKKYLRTMSSGFESPKLTQHIGDGFAFMKQHLNEFDVIITDSSDQIGPAAELFEDSYYVLLTKALKPGGIICTQEECVWLNLEEVKTLHKFCKTLFPVVDYGYCTIPSYPSGQIGFTLCSLNPDTNFRKPIRSCTNEVKKTLNLKYYNSDIHKAAFVLPEFARKFLENEDDGENEK